MNRTVFITGATSGIGQACASRFAASGDRLVLAARRKDRLKRLQGDLGGLEQVHVCALDIRDRQAVFDSVHNLPESFSSIDILVNNAGLAQGTGAVDQASLDDWEVMVDTNIKGLLTCTRAILPQMVERDQGHVVNIGSVAASWPFPKSNVYGASKAFVHQFSRSIRTDLMGSHVRVTTIEPGLVRTEFAQVRSRGDAEAARAAYEGKEILEPEDVAETVFWVTSLPRHVNVNRLEVMSTCQAWVGMGFGC